MASLEEMRMQVAKLREAKARTDEYNRLAAERQNLIRQNRQAGFVTRHQTTGRIASAAASFGTSASRAKVAGAVDKFREFGKKRQGLVFR